MYNCTHLDDSHPHIRDQLHGCEHYYVPDGVNQYRLCQFNGTECITSDEIIDCVLQDNRIRIGANKSDYERKMYGFWLGQSVANWLGLKTENMFSHPSEFLYDDDWGSQKGHAQSNAAWAGLGCCPPNDANNEYDNAFNTKIDFVVFTDNWPSDDDTDLEYMYQYLLFENNVSVLTPEHIRNGWLTHMRLDNKGRPVWLWVSNARAYNLMSGGTLPPQTGDPSMNAEWEMIDAQLTTEIFGLFAPGDPDVALKTAFLPIRTVARGNAAIVAEFYVIMHSLAVLWDPQNVTLKTHLFWTADVARTNLPNHTYAAKMYDFVREKYETNATWYATRDSLHYRYMVNKSDGFDYLNGNGASRVNVNAGINFACSLVSLFWGEADFRETLKIGTLCGWDSDNPTATWGGLLGFYMGETNIRNLFLPGTTLGSYYYIHRTRQNFPRDADSFADMAATGVMNVERTVTMLMDGHVQGDHWYWSVTHSS